MYFTYLHKFKASGAQLYAAIYACLFEHLIKIINNNYYFRYKCYYGIRFGEVVVRQREGNAHCCERRLVVRS